MYLNKQNFFLINLNFRQMSLYSSILNIFIRLALIFGGGNRKK